MFKKVALATLAAFALAIPFCAQPPQAQATSQVPGAAYCAPVYTIPFKGQIVSQPLNNEFVYENTCLMQYGDIFTDGPLFSPSFSYSGSSFGFTIPANSWVGLGTRVLTSAVSEVAGASTTTYYWLDVQTGAFLATLVDTAPNAYSVLEYTVTTNGSGVTAVTNPTLAGEILGGTLTLSALTSGQCLQTGTNGVITGTGQACGGSDVILQSPFPSAPPGFVQNGQAAITGPITIWPFYGPSPSPYASASEMPDAFHVAGAPTNCLSAGYTAWGTTANTINGIAGESFAIQCGGNTFDKFNVNGSGEVSTALGYNGSHLILWGTGSYVQFPDSSNGVGPCNFQDTDGSGGGPEIVHVTGGQKCTLVLPDLAASTNLCLDSNSAVSPCPSPTPTVASYPQLVCSGFVTCSPSSGPSPAIAVPVPTTSSDGGCGAISATTTGSTTTYYLQTTTCAAGSSHAVVTASPPIVVTETTASPATYQVSCPTCATTTTSTYSSYILANYASLDHYWKMSDTPGPSTPNPGQCPSTMADSVGTSTMSTSTPVAVSVVESPGPHPAGSIMPIVCGVPGLKQDGTVGTQWNFAYGGYGYFQIPASVFAADCNNAGSGTNNCNESWTLECVVKNSTAGNTNGSWGGTGYNTLFQIDTAGNDLALLLGEGSYDEPPLWSAYIAANTDYFGIPGGPQLIDYEYNTSDGNSYMFLDGVYVSYSNVAPRLLAGSVAYFGNLGTTSVQRMWNGKMHGCALYDTGLTPTQIYTNYTKLGAPFY